MLTEEFNLLNLLSKPRYASLLVEKNLVMFRGKQLE